MAKKHYPIIIFTVVVVLIVVGGFLYLETRKTIPEQCKELEGGMQSECIVNVALEEENIELCTTLDELWLEECYQQFAKKFNSTAYCQSIKGKEARDGCFVGFVVDEEQANICYDTITDYWNNICYDRIARASLKSSWCREIYNYDMEIACLTDIAVATDSTEECENIVLVKDYDTCYLRVATNSLNASHCDSILSNFDRNNCKFRIGVRSLSREVCEEITIEEMKDTCLERVEELKAEEQQ
jgi:hypothetical protein